LFTSKDWTAKVIVCIPNGEAIASVGGATQGYRFDWYANNDFSSPVFTGEQILTLDSISYQVIATNLETGCVSSPTQVTILDAITDPEFNVNFTNSLCLRTDNGSINDFSGSAFIEFVQPANIDAADTTDYEYIGIDSIRWTSDDGFQESYDIQLIDARPGTWSVWFRTSKGCDYTAAFEITASIKIYNGISANNDGLNDFLLLDCLDLYPGNNVQIFTRGGTKVWETDDYDNLISEKRFEGVSNIGASTRKLPVGTYFYVIDLNDGSDIIQGYLELVR
jgi:hypothetical protein